VDRHSRERSLRSGLTIKPYECESTLIAAAPTALASVRVEGRAWVDNAGVEDETVLLFRPVWPAELDLVLASGWRRWPPRLPEQPIFYPVTNFQYAREIAEKWNVSESRAGYVTRFRVRAAFMNAYAVHTVGGSNHMEWWVPAEDLEELNAQIVGRIEVIASYGESSSMGEEHLLQIETAVGDILTQDVEAIVNPWNRNFIPWWLLVPQGVSGAIRRAAGSKPFQEIRRYGVLRPGTLCLHQQAVCRSEELSM